MIVHVKMGKGFTSYCGQELNSLFSLYSVSRAGYMHAKPAHAFVSNKRHQVNSVTCNVCKDLWQREIGLAILSEIDL